MFSVKVIYISYIIIHLMSIFMNDIPWNYDTPKHTLKATCVLLKYMFTPRLFCRGKREEVKNKLSLKLKNTRHNKAKIKKDHDCNPIKLIPTYEIFVKSTRCLEMYLHTRKQIIIIHHITYS